MAVLLSDLYGKEIITTTGKILGKVEDLIIDFEHGAVHSLLLTKIDNIIRSEKTPDMINKNSVNYTRVKSVSETIIVGVSK
ncbi:MAG: PRC-barrel domain-containing protein [Candidatus Marsarchaeota archaeon]|nr:PRC-barrel domain-containing protein [Candidatus Marsarchaeota archaeon]MCL5106307.1 PRC-barrel domain-containing protein [Candidatus Marsarchaeota archaeon]